MAAINLLVLRKQLNQLLWYFTDADVFVKEMLAFLEKYRSPVYGHGGNLTAHEIVLQDLRVPAMVLREIDLAISPIITEQPETALKICEKLWEHPNPELHTIALLFLGKIPILYAASVLQFVDRWVQDGLDATAANVLLRNSTALIRRIDPDLLMVQAKDWCENRQGHHRRTGIQAMISLAQDDKFQNLPAIFAILEQLLLDLPMSLFADVLDLIRVLTRRSEMESAYFMRQLIQKNTSQSHMRIVRKSIPFFSASTAQSLQVLLRQTAKM